MTPSSRFRRIGAAKDPCASAYSYEPRRFLPMPLLLDRRLVVVTGKGGVGRGTAPGGGPGGMPFRGKFGRTSLQTILSAAIALAEDGFPVSEITALEWQAS